MAKITGGCMCGAVRYEAEGEPMAHAICHCTDCQRANGGGSTYALIYSAASFRVTKGTPKAYSKRADSGKDVGRFFCADCGTPVFSKPSMEPPIVPVRVGSLDDPSIFKPSVQIFTDSALPWMHIDDRVPALKRGIER